MKRKPQSKQRRLDDHELPEDLRPLEATEPSPEQVGSPEINERFIAFGGNPEQLNDAASIASAGLVIAEQIADLTTAIHTLNFMLCKNP